MKKKSKRNLPAPEPPPNAEDYILVRTKEGPYWRRKRGSVKKATLNKQLQHNADTTAFFNNAAKKIKDKLEEFLRGLETGRFIANVSGKLKSAYNRRGEFDFSLLQGYELQPYHPLSTLLTYNCQVLDNDQQLTITLPIDAYTIKQLNPSVSAYYVELILLHGDPSTTNGLKLDSDISRLYTFKEKAGTTCRLSLEMPGNKIPWMLLLKVSCHEGDSPAGHCRHYGMKIIKTG